LLTWGMVIFLGICLVVGLVGAGFLIGGGISSAFTEWAEDWNQIKHWEMLMKKCALTLKFEQAGLEYPEWLEDESDWDEEPKEGTVIRLVPKEAADEPSPKQT